ncbi:cation:proton antiporter [Desulfohalovibrio reitneri]|uniref:cation:proton antiporter domain-containing protein n=1 Tax=Desulfohalovibrio reitneri TaxID=1307759 RepID=UPI0004A71F94|nr:cation:proton antiporter [Desulfohalovibrio reitneri]
MHAPPLLDAIILVLCVSAGMVFLCHRLRLPASVGFLLTGVAMGPHGLEVVHSAHDIEILAEIGVILLLFVIGLEFSVKRLGSIKRLALAGGGGQVLLTLGAAALLALLLAGRELPGAVFIGFITALSSTAIVLKLLKDRGEIDAPHGNACLAILIFQDIAVVPMMLLIPLLAGQGGGSPMWDLAVMVGKAGLLVGGVLVLTNTAVPWLLHQVARTRSNETFLLAIVGICLGVAALSNALGMSFALGAFLAGLTISESEYSHQAAASILPFHDVFLSFFFVSMGMLLDVGFVLSNPWLVLGLALGLGVLKFTLAAGAGRLAGLPLAASLLTGFALFQVGEFSFVLARQGEAVGLLPQREYQLFLAAAVLTMVATPFVLAAGSRVARATSRLHLPAPGRPHTGGHKELRDHLVVIGFGPTGRHVVQAAKAWRVPYWIIEGNPDTVRTEASHGEPISFGDATSSHILEEAGIENARMVAVAVSDPVASRRAVDQVRRLNPRVRILVRSTFLTDLKEFRDMGADDVVTSEMEASVEMVARMLRTWLVPEREIDGFLEELRAGDAMARPTVRPELVETRLPDMKVAHVRVEPGAGAEGKTLGELALRKEHSVSILAIRKQGQNVRLTPGANDLVEVGDLLLLAGEPEQVRQARRNLFASPETA